MRHRKKGRKLGRTAQHRRATLRNMATSLFRHERIETTTAKAKELRPYAERLITLAKRGDLHARRQASAKVQDREVLGKYPDSEARAPQRGRRGDVAHRAGRLSWPPQPNRHLNRTGRRTCATTLPGAAQWTWARSS